MPYKTPAPHATHRQESVAAQDPWARAGIIQKANSSRGPFRFSTWLCPETLGSLQSLPCPPHAKGACAQPATQLHSQRGRHSSEAPRQSRSPPARIAAPGPAPRLPPRPGKGRLAPRTASRPLPPLRLAQHPPRHLCNDKPPLGFGKRRALLQPGGSAGGDGGRSPRLGQVWGRPALPAGPPRLEILSTE